MTAIGIIAIVVTSALCYGTSPKSEKVGTATIFACFAMHIMMSLLFWQYSLYNPADSHAYYNDSRDLANSSFRPGTVFVTQAVDVLRSAGATYLDSFLVFQSFSFAGICFLFRAFREIARDLNVAPAVWGYLLLLLPGLHFWTSSLGKDSLVFTGCVLCIWASMRVGRRIPAYLLGLLVLLLVRPHVAGIAVLSLLASLVLDARVRVGIKVPVLMLATAAAIVIFSTVESTLSISALNPDSVTEFIASKQEVGARQEGGADITGLPLALKVLSLLFRPLFLDAEGMMGLVVSIENLVLIFVFGTLLVRLPTLLKLSINVVYVRYCLIFSAALILLLSLVNYNVGLGLRQKYMAMPAVLMLFATVIIYSRAVRLAANPNVRASESFPSNTAPTEV